MAYELRNDCVDCEICYNCGRRNDYYQAVCDNCGGDIYTDNSYCYRDEMYCKECLQDTILDNYCKLEPGTEANTDMEVSLQRQFLQKLIKTDETDIMKLYDQYYSLSIEKLSSLLGERFGETIKTVKSLEVA